MSTSTAGSPKLSSPPPSVSDGFTWPRRLGIFASLAFSLALCLYLMGWWYQFQGFAFHRFTPYLLAGFTVHFFLPRAWRHLFFTLLSMGSVPLIFGVVQGAWMLVLGLAVIGICHLPLVFWQRIVLLIGAGALFAAQRLGAVPEPWSAAIWPVFGSMFSIRLLIYLYDLKHTKQPFKLLDSLGYFFMVPNVVFPLFPAVDYQTFVRSPGKENELHLVRLSGVQWMARGVFQLVLYRLVYQYMPIDTTQVLDLASLLRYLMWPFMLYLNVSGQFHFVIGVVRLFGYALPETHHLFYLASSFTDFWRRINIYWKDFMMKVFYYPSYFKLRRLGNTWALVLGTVWVFMATWFFHAWLWFWIRGEFLLATHDILFWVVLCALVAMNVVTESRQTPAQRLAASRGGTAFNLGLAARTTGVWLTICVLWSMWITESTGEWLSLFLVGGRLLPESVPVLLVILAGIALHFTAGFLYAGHKARPLRFVPESLRVGALLLALLVIAAPPVYKRLPEAVGAVIHQAKSPVMNQRDKNRRQRDYYEKLNDVGWDNPALNQVFKQKPADWKSLKFSTLSVSTSDLPFLLLNPGASERHKGVMVTVNSLGQRDKETGALPAPGVERILMLGASHLYGSGVEQEKDFESLFEDSLNASGYGPLELVNCAVEGYTPLDILYRLRRRDRALAPDAALYVGHIVDGKHSVDRLSERLASGWTPDDPWLAELVRRAGARTGAEENANVRALRPFERELLTWIYRGLKAECDTLGIPLQFVYLPLLTTHELALGHDDIVAIAAAAGLPVWDLDAVYSAFKPEDLHVAAWDDHPGARGHALVAADLFARITADTSLVRRH